MAWNWGGANGSPWSELGLMDKILNAHKEMNKILKDIPFEMNP